MSGFGSIDDLLNSEKSDEQVKEDLGSALHISSLEKEEQFKKKMGLVQIKEKEKSIDYAICESMQR